MMLKHLITFVILFAFSCSDTKYPTKVKMICFPFRTHTVVSISEHSFEIVAAPNDLSFIKTRFEEITNPSEVKKVVDLLMAVIKRKEAHLDDVSLRASITLDGENDKYYFNWDKKHIIYKLKNYPISQIEFNEFKRLTNMCSD